MFLTNKWRKSFGEIDYFLFHLRVVAATVTEVEVY